MKESNSFFRLFVCLGWFSKHLFLGVYLSILLEIVKKKKNVQQRVSSIVYSLGL